MNLGLAEPGAGTDHTYATAEDNDHDFHDDAPTAAVLPRFPLPRPTSDRAASGDVVLDHGLRGHLPDRAAVGSDPR